jgi:GAF domain-containing protein
MPYVRCRSCQLTSYAPRSGGVCPDCGAPLSLRGAEAAGGDPGRRLDALLRLTRELLDADIAILSQIRGRREVIERFAGDWPHADLAEGSSLPLADTICQRLLDGRIGNFIGDVDADERVRDLTIARQLGIRAWIGVSIAPTDVELYVLCCLAREARPRLGEREVRLLRGLAESVRAELQTTPR